MAILDALQYGSWSPGWKIRWTVRETSESAWKSYFYVSGGLIKIFSAVRGLEVLSKPIFFEATSAHPKFYVEEHVWPICKTPESVLVYANLCLRKQ